jgi:hypothetical protein
VHCRPLAVFLDLEAREVGDWNALDKAQKNVELEAKTTGKRLEIWVTVVGRLQTRTRRSALGLCDRNSWFPGYGHLGAFPAQIVVESFSDIEVKVNPQSPYDYSNIYHGPA